MYNSLKLKEKIVLMIINDNADDLGKSCISYDDIINCCSDLFKITKKETHLIINKLITNGLISILSKGCGKTKTTYLTKKGNRLTTDMKQIDNK